MTKDKLRVYGPLVLNIHLLIFFYSKLYKNWDIFFICVIVSSCYAVVTWETTRWVTMYYQKRIPGIQHVRKRLITILLWMIPITVAGTVFNQVLKIWLKFFAEITMKDFLFIEGLSVIISLLIVGIYEGMYYMQEWKRVYTQAEKFRKVNEASRYQFLEEQIKPHFLFNSLNTLTSLIGSKPEKAIAFTEEMSSVYRYLLKRNGNELTTVKDELSFLQSYITMLETRFEGSLFVDIDITESYLKRLIPPFVLQLLVENAIKHNIISQKNPLYISIQWEPDGFISVTNNLQKKSGNDHSEKKGLTNLIERYRLLKQEDNLHISEDGTYFRVMIPLLKTHAFTAVEF